MTAHQQITDRTTYTTAYEYNLSGALVKETYPSGREVTNTLDGNGDLASTWSKKSGGISRVYLNDIVRDTAGSITSMKLGNGRFENAAYNSRQQITQIGIGSSATDSGLLKLEFNYTTPSTTNNNGSMREQKVTVPTVGSNSGFTAIQAYTYDDLNRLTTATETVSSSQTWKQTFTYDRFGNRRFDTSGSNTTTLGSCSAAVCNPTISTSNNQISQSGYDYDENGNLTVDGAGNQFTYDAENHQKEVKDSGNNSLGTYQYDGDGRRVKKVAGSETTIFVYNGGGQLVAEYSTVTPTTPQVSYLTQDHLGSPRVITNENGVVTSRKDFAAFGDEVTSAQRVSGGSGNGYTADEVRKDYTGYEKDTESGLQFAQARYYNTTHGRYTSVDPLTASASIKNPQTFNRYSYVLNSPYKFVDPLGLISQSTGACGSDCQNSDGFSGGHSESWIKGNPFDEGRPTIDSQSNAAANTPPPPVQVTDLFSALFFYYELRDSEAYLNATADGAIYDSGTQTGYLETPAGRSAMRPFISRLLTKTCGAAFRAVGFQTPREQIEKGDLKFAARELLESSSNNEGLGISEEARRVKNTSRAPETTLQPRESNSGKNAIVFVSRAAFTELSNMIFTDFAAHGTIHAQNVGFVTHWYQVPTPLGYIGGGHDLSAFPNYDSIINACSTRRR